MSRCAAISGLMPLATEYARNGRTARLGLAFKRARWYDGRAVGWLGARRSTGRGEASSGLDWDVLTDTPGAT
jgi:hypothetical protein